MRRLDYIDDDVETVNRWEGRRYGAPVKSDAPENKGRRLVGQVERFFDRINVAAVKLTGRLKVGDIIEIGDDEEAIRQRVSSMQIDKESITEAAEGDDIGIKLNYSVPVGSAVYVIEQHIYSP